MEVCKSLVHSVILFSTFVVLCALLYLFWRHIWFFRNPPRKPPVEDSGVLSPADGTVVYAKPVSPGEAVISIKRGLSATVGDITKEDIFRPKILIGIFMSPFSVHFNRVPVPGQIGFIRHHPASVDNACMASMHLRTIFKSPPLYRNSVHIVQNERTVTKFDGQYRGNPLSCYVVQIAAKNVNGIDSFFKEGDRVSAGQVFGMIRIGSQVDLVITPREGIKIRVKPGDRVRAGETILIE
jgi:phosphatidylserine decarboxylase